MKSDKLQDAFTDIKDEFIQEAHEEIIYTKPRFNYKKAALALVCTFAVVIGLPKVLPHPYGNLSSQSYEASYDNYVEQPYQYDTDSYEVMDGAMAKAESTSEEGSPVTKQDNAKIIQNASMDLETKDVDKTMSSVEELVNKYNGYIQSSTMYNDSYAYYYMTIRIPSDQFESCINDIKGLGNVTSYSRSTDDVTEQYTDYEAKLKSYKKQEKKLMEMYDQATNVSELMDIESRISEVQYEIDFYESMIKNYDTLIEYSTLDLNISEIKVYSNTETGFLSRLGEAFENGWYYCLSTIEEFIITVVYNLWLVVIVVLGFVGFKVYKKKKQGK